MTTHDGPAVATELSVEPVRWREQFEELMGRIAGRCHAAGIPQGTVFATKPKLARRMIGRALDAGTPAAWVTADEVYGADPGLRTDLERRRIGYVLAVAAAHRMATAAGTCAARQLAARLPALLRGPGRQGPPLRPARDWQGWTNTRSAAGTPGTGGPP